jgi:hypothetical protein
MLCASIHRCGSTMSCERWKMTISASMYNQIHMEAITKERNWNEKTIRMPSNHYWWTYRLVWTIFNTFKNDCSIELWRMPFFNSHPNTLPIHIWAVPKVRIEIKNDLEAIRSFFDALTCWTRIVLAVYIVILRLIRDISGGRALDSQNLKRVRIWK